MSPKPPVLGRRQRALVVAAFVALLAGALFDGLEGLAQADWIACLAHSDGSALGPPRIAERSLTEVFWLFVGHMADTPQAIWRSGFGARWGIAMAGYYLPIFGLALPIGLARQRATKVIFAIAVLGVVLLYILMLPPATTHHCDSNGVRLTFGLVPLLTIFAAVPAMALTVLSTVWGARRSGAQSRR
ncbi:hypothetical protein SAMN05877809_10249 [Rhodobacter sp. JA431]|uniref:hypothetical protein n=1 Tax=Rhodobacter sp. JA431 TaxID=570013 RepID=UPI000BDD4B53|nr:hypothetical protein [Rhodobacter sp. JA431]SOB97850.1 hypothetical protein SAMN05877809_10249 [Rhodobacter sp. JA431]